MQKPAWGGFSRTRTKEGTHTATSTHHAWLRDGLHLEQPITTPHPPTQVLGGPSLRAG